MNFLKSALLILTLAPGSVALGQTQPLPASLSLDGARKLAMAQNPMLRSKALDVERAQKKTERARMDRVPDVYGSFELRRNLIIPTTPVPAQAFDPEAPAGELLPLKFSTDYTSNAGFNAQWDVFDPQSSGQVKVAEQQKALSETDHKTAENNLYYLIGEDYAACATAAAQLRMAAADTVSKAEVLTATKARYEAGRAKTSAFNQALSDLNDTRGAFLQAKKILSSAKAKLLVDMGYNPKAATAFALTDSLQTLLQSTDTPPEGQNQSLAVTRAEQQTELTQTRLHNTRMGFLPSVAVKGFYGANYYSNALDLTKSADWYGNSFVGVSLNLPITRGLGRAKNIDGLKIQLEADREQLRDQTDKTALARVKAAEDFAYKKQDLALKLKNMALFAENRQAAEDQFAKGQLTADDLADSGYRYNRAKNAYLQAAYDCIVAYMRWQKAMRQ